MAIAVLGMHRSGTSMVTRMLAACGMEIGSSADLMPATEENPTGYFERQSMMTFNDAILEELGLAWDYLPQLPAAGWHEEERFDSMLQHLETIFSSFPAENQAVWGFKDPRMSILLPLAERVLAEPANVVVCIRNPLDVAISLQKRGSMSLRLSSELWLRYTQSAMSMAKTRKAVFTHYDAYFQDAEAELRRVTDAVGLDVSDEKRALAATGAIPAHRHSANGLASLVMSAVSDEVVATYIQCLAACGPVMAQVASSDAFVIDSDSQDVELGDAMDWVRETRSQLVSS